MAADLGLIDKTLASASVEAYRHYRNIQREIRLSRGETVKARVEPETVKADAAAVLSLWQAVFGTAAPQRNA